jgi:heat shock protein beta
LVLKKEALEYLDEEKVKELVAKHSGFASSFPIYLFTNRTEERPVPQDDMDAMEEKPKVGDEEILIEDTPEKKDENAAIPMRKVTIEEWVHLNNQAPLWAR